MSQPSTLDRLGGPERVSPRVLQVASLGDRNVVWDALVSASRHPNPFASSWWLEGRDPGDRCVLLVLIGDRLVGGLGLTRRDRLGLSTYTLPGASFAAPDHQDVLALPGHEAEVIDALRAWLASEGPFLFRATGVDVDALLGRVFGRACTVVPFSSAPYLPLDPSIPVAPISGRLRSTIQRAEKRLGRRRLEFRRTSGASSEFERALDSLVRLHRLRWPKGSRFLDGLPTLSPVLVAGAEAGGVEIHELHLDGTVVASMLLFVHGGHACFYQSGRVTGHDVRGAGSVLMSRVIADCQARDYREFDFLRGAESYKFDWTQRQRPLGRMIAAQGAVPRLARSVLVATERARPAVRRVRDAVGQWRARPTRNPS